MNYSKRGHTPNEIEEFLSQQNYRFRRNIVKNRTEYSLNDKEFALLDEYTLNSLHRLVLNNGFACTKALLRDLLYSEFAKNADPFLEYFKRLAPWDETKQDFIELLAETVTTTNPALWKKCIKKWLVSTVACAVKPSVVNHGVLVLAGAQNLGKTTWLSKLMPKTLLEYFHTGTIHPNNKDALIFLSECLLINLDELENLNKTELGSLKSLITLANINVRKPYAYNPETFIRRASFMGSVNNHEFLNDTTGNRRYLCFSCTTIDKGHSVDMDDVFAQAYALYKQGFTYWFTDQEVEEIERSNEQFRFTTLEEELLMKYFRKPVGDETYELLTPTEILQHLAMKSGFNMGNDIVLRKLGMALHKRNFVQTSTKVGKPYKVKFVVASAQGIDTEWPQLMELLLPGYYYLYRGY